MPTLRTTPTYIAADLTQQKLVTVSTGGNVFYKATNDVDSEDTKLEVGDSVTLTAGAYFISASTSKVRIDDVDSPTVEDLTVSDDLTVKGDAAVTGAATVTGKLTAKGEVEIDGDLNHDSTKVGLYGTAPVTQQEVKKSELTAGELATALAKTGIIKVEA